MSDRMHFFSSSTARRGKRAGAKSPGWNMEPEALPGHAAMPAHRERLSSAMDAGIDQASRTAANNRPALTLVQRSPMSDYESEAQRAPAKANSMDEAESTLQRGPAEPARQPDPEATKARAERALEQMQDKISILAAAHDAPGLSASEKAKLRAQMRTLQRAGQRLVQELANARDGGAGGQDVTESLGLAGVLLATPIPGDELAGAALVLVQAIRWLLTAAAIIGTGILVKPELISSIEALEAAIAAAGGMLAAQYGKIDDVAKEAPEVWEGESPSELYPEIATAINELLALLAFDTGSGPGGREPDPDRPNRLANLIARVRELMRQLRQESFNDKKVLRHLKWLGELVNKLAGGA